MCPRYNRSRVDGSSLGFEAIERVSGSVRSSYENAQSSLSATTGLTSSSPAAPFWKRCARYGRRPVACRRSRCEKAS